MKTDEDYVNRIEQFLNVSSVNSFVRSLLSRKEVISVNDFFAIWFLVVFYRQVKAVILSVKFKSCNFGINEWGI